VFKLNKQSVAAALERNKRLRFSPSLHGELFISMSAFILQISLNTTVVNCFFGAEYESQKLRYEGSE
jgi:hypothetical protein